MAWLNSLFGWVLGGLSALGIVVESPQPWNDSERARTWNEKPDPHEVEKTPNTSKVFSLHGGGAPKNDRNAMDLYKAAILRIFASQNKSKWQER